MKHSTVWIKQAVLLLLPLWAGVAVSAHAGEPDDPAPCLLVDSGYTPATGGWGATHFSSLQNALSALREDGTIFVAAGTYAVPSLRVGLGVKIAGSGSGATVFQPSESVTSNGWWNVLETGSLSLRGCTLQVASNQCAEAAVAIRSCGTLDVQECAILLPADCRAIESARTATASHNYWGLATPEFCGLFDTGRVIHEPWYVDSKLTELVFADGVANVDGALAVSSGKTLSVDTVNLAPGASLNVDGGALSVAELNMDASSSIAVSDGEVLFQTSEGETSVAGTFTLYDSMGSMFIENDTTFSGDTLALVSHIAVSDGVAVRVAGSLVLDGCVVDCADEGGSYLFEVLDGAAFQMARTEMADCASLGISNAVATVQSCTFMDSSIQISTAASGVRFFHNVLLGNSQLHDAGTDTVLTVDGWANVDNISNTWNRIALDWRGENLPVGRTLSQEGLFVQPGDQVELQIDLSSLSMPVSGCEMLLGYNGTYFTNGTFALESPWDFNIFEEWSLEGGDPVFGKIDSGIGLGMSAPREGISADGAVATVSMQAREREGQTMFYFRPQINESWETRLASDTNGYSGVYLAPFTENSRTVTVDGTPPSMHSFSGFQDQDGASVDVFDPSNKTFQGSVLITMQASDELAGLIDPELSVVERNGAQASYSPTLLTAMESGGGMLWLWNLPITPSMESGIYDVVGIVADRSGNAVTNAATLEISTTEVLVNVDRQVAPVNPFDEWVRITPLDAALDELPSDDYLLAFDNSGHASVRLEGLPHETAYLRVKGATTLSRVQPVAFNVNMQATVEFSGAAALLCGDLTGDNAININDYGVVRYYWLTAESSADINKDGAVNITDYGIIRFNWLELGE